MLKTYDRPQEDEAQWLAGTDWRDFLGVSVPQWYVVVKNDLAGRRGASGHVQHVDGQALDVDLEDDAVAANAPAPRIVFALETHDVARTRSVTMTGGDELL